MSWGQPPTPPPTPPPKTQTSWWLSPIRSFGFAPLLFLVMLVSLRAGGPIGVVKVAFGSNPWAKVLIKNQSQSDDPVWRAQFEKMEETRVRYVRRNTLIAIVFGGISFFLSLSLFTWMFFLSRGPLRVLYALGVALGVLVLVFAFAIRNTPFGPL